MCIAVVTMLIWAIRCLINFRSVSRFDVCARLMINGAYDIMLLGLWTYSAAVQNSGDFTDAKHISVRPWYLQRGCSGLYERHRSACELMGVAYGISAFLT